YANRRVGGTLEQRMVARPDCEIEAVRPGIIEKTCDLRRRPDFARPRVHFRPVAWRKEIRSAIRRSCAFRSFFEPRVAELAIERRASPTEFRRRTATHRPVECRHPALQLLVDLLELVDPLQLIHRNTESG